MEAEHNWGIAWLTMGLLLFVGMVGIFMKTSSQLDQL
jgi:hypothetical protein